ncbi:hypothetical protein CLG96_05480 [Sphingomonas oleivorans]|uniref:Transposase DDE domain-containing protein n=1 Tax=Sphingomonas oleivorans TaxID=1735121 RepID=A0A2T5FZ94_9SPHN|nr:hypothetical protein CLG96_05480 [Sphingomonas oleivorans]
MMPIASARRSRPRAPRPTSRPAGKGKPCFGQAAYRERNRIERVFSKLKPVRRVALRLDAAARLGGLA